MYCFIGVKEGGGREGGRVPYLLSVSVRLGLYFCDFPYAACILQASIVKQIKFNSLTHNINIFLRARYCPD